MQYTYISQSMRRLAGLECLEQVSGSRNVWIGARERKSCVVSNSVKERGGEAAVADQRNEKKRSVGD